MSGDRVNVSPQDLKAAAEGINAVIGELNSLAGDKVSGDVGRGFDDMKMSGLQIGTQECKDAFDRFCDRWQWGVRTLVKDANTIAELLGLDAGMYHDVDQFVGNTLKELAVDAMSVVSDPHVTDQQADQMSWGQIVSSPLHDFDNPDGQAAVQQLRKDASTNWSSVWDSSALGRMQHHDYNPFDHGQGYKHG
jgi:hypothetical protein